MNRIACFGCGYPTLTTDLSGGMCPGCNDMMLLFFDWDLDEVAARRMFMQTGHFETNDTAVDANLLTLAGIDAGR